MKKHIIALSGAAMLLVSAIPTVAYASNFADTSFVFTFYNPNSLPTYVQNENRPKEDSTSSYMKCNTAVGIYGGTSGYTYKATVHGSSSISGGLADCYYGSSHSKTESLTANTTKYLTNYVKETGHAYANIYCEPGKYTYNTKYSGVWSPDSI